MAGGGRAGICRAAGSGEACWVRGCLSRRCVNWAAIGAGGGAVAAARWDEMTSLSLGLNLAYRCSQSITREPAANDPARNSVFFISTNPTSKVYYTTHPPPFCLHCPPLP